MEHRSDMGATHVALPVTDIERSIAFYGRYAGMQVVHRRTDEQTGSTVVWLSDLTRPFVVVLIQAPMIDHSLGGMFCHLGVGVGSRNEVERRCVAAHEEGLQVMGPIDSGYPVGYWAYIVHPDGHNLELSHGQEVGLTVAQHSHPPA
ncbi:MAG: VOC family protein [Deltaproteobacteria bacterium]|nr:VOC family protein [Deltaproteobacteria bacterium]